MLILCLPLFRPYDMFVTLLIAILLLISALIFLVHLVMAVKERFRHKQRLGLLVLMPIPMALFIFVLFGLPKEMQHNDSILEASREGAVNCMTYFKLEKDNRFKATSICFGTSVTKGNYHLKGDTIFLTDISSDDRRDKPYYSFGLIKSGIHIPAFHTDTTKIDTTKYLHLYYSHSDSMPLWLYISHNSLSK